MNFSLQWALGKPNNLSFSAVNKMEGNTVCLWNGFSSAKMTNKHVVCGNKQQFPVQLPMRRNKKELSKISWSMHSTLFRQIPVSQSCLDWIKYEQKYASLTWRKEKGTYTRQDLFSSGFHF